MQASPMDPVSNLFGFLVRLQSSRGHGIIVRTCGRIDRYNFIDCPGFSREIIFFENRNPMWMDFMSYGESAFEDPPVSRGE
jgi:hypothetical protein